MSNQLVVGDVVVLKSGSLPMTVEEVEDGDISCVWQNDQRKIERGTFPAAALKKYEAKSV